MFSELVAELPFTLMHPKPEDTENRAPSRSESGSLKSEKQNGEKSGVESGQTANEETLTDTNLIQLDT